MREGWGREGGRDGYTGVLRSCIYEICTCVHMHAHTVTPTTIHQVPPVVIAGKREQVHTIITSKPSPSPADTLGVAVDLIIQNVSIVPLGNASTELVSDPTNVMRFIAIHTFDVPSDIDEESEAVFIRFRFTEPGTWMHLDRLVQVVPVVIGEKLILVACMHIIYLDQYLVYIFMLLTFMSLRSGHLYNNVLVMQPICDTSSYF